MHLNLYNLKRTMWLSRVVNISRQVHFGPANACFSWRFKEIRQSEFIYDIKVDLAVGL